MNNQEPNITNKKDGIVFFKTQKEAIEFAKNHPDIEAGDKVFIHSKTGRIRSIWIKK